MSLHRYISHPGESTWVDAMAVGGAGSEYISAGDDEPLFVGSNFFTGPSYDANEAFLSFDTSGVTTTPASASLALSLTVDVPSTTTVYVGVYNWGASIDAADWRTAAALAGVTVAGSVLLTSQVAGDIVTITLDPSTIVVGGTTRYVLYDGNMASNTPPTAEHQLLFDGDASGGVAPVLTTGGALFSVDPYRVLVDTTVIGDDVHIDLHGVEGLGVPDAKTQDVVYVHRDGVYGNPDYTAIRLVTIPVIIRSTDAATALSELHTLQTLWAERLSDIPLTMNLPGWGNFTMYGRPRGLKADLEYARFGVIRALLRFDCPDPTITFA